MSEHDIMTVAEVAAYLGMSEEFVREHSSTRTRPARPVIPAYKMGGSVRFFRPAIRQFLEDQIAAASKQTRRGAA